MVAYLALVGRLRWHQPVVAIVALLTAALLWPAPGPERAAGPAAGGPKSIRSLEVY